MEAKSVDEILDVVKSILSTTPLIAQDRTTTILPASIPSIPKHSSQLPTSSLPLQRSLEKLTRDVLPYLNKSSLSARYYGFVTGGVTPAALIGDVLTSIFDQNVSVHLPHDTIATAVEVAALNMLVDLLNLPSDDWSVGTSGSGGGTFTTGATASNILGLALGREYILSAAALRNTGKKMSVGEDGLLAVCQAAQVDHVKILSTLPHSSIAKAASIVGLGRNSIISIAKKGTSLAIDIESLQSMAEDAEAERTAYILAVSAGEVNTGHFASDSLSMMKQVREICDKYNIWIHVDGAFGLFGRVLLGHAQEKQYQQITHGVRGLELADSITSDGHKLLNVPYDCGIFFTRHKQLSLDVFQNGNAAYLQTTAEDDIQTPLNIGIENSRRFRALPVYATLSAYGREGYADMLIRQIGLARRIAKWISEHDRYELLPQGESLDKIFMIVLFRAKEGELNARLVKTINASGKMYVSGTQWSGQPAARIAISNWRVNVEEDAAIVEDVLGTISQH